MHNVSIPVNGSKSCGWKHDFLELSVGGCSSYDVIARWPDLTRSNFLPKVAQRMLHKLCKISAWSAQRFGNHIRKTHGGDITPLARTRVKRPLEVFIVILKLLEIIMAHTCWLFLNIHCAHFGKKSRVRSDQVTRAGQLTLPQKMSLHSGYSFLGDRHGTFRSW